MTIKASKYVKINSVNPSYLFFSKANGCSEEINKSKYLLLVPTEKSKKIFKNMKNCGLKPEISLVQ